MPMGLGIAFAGVMAAIPVQYSAGSPQQDLYESIQAFRSSFVETAMARGPAAMALLDERRLEVLLKDAETLSRQGEAARATATLQSAYDLTEQALIRLRDNETVVYERRFRTPADEYRYERDLMNSYDQLLSRALEQDTPAEAAALADRARIRKAQAEAEASSGDYASAARTAESASEILLHALQKFGLMATR